MKMTILGIAEAGKPLLQLALQAIHAHHPAVDDGVQLPGWNVYALKQIPSVRLSSTPTALGRQAL